MANKSSKKLITKLVQENVQFDRDGFAMIAVASSNKKRWDKGVENGTIFIEDRNLYMKMTKKQWANQKKRDGKLRDKHLP